MSRINSDESAEAIRKIVPYLESWSEEARRDAAWYLRLRATNSIVVDILLPRAKNPKDPVRWNALKALTGADPRLVLPAFDLAITDADPKLRKELPRMLVNLASRHFHRQTVTTNGVRFAADTNGPRLTIAFAQGYEVDPQRAKLVSGTLLRLLKDDNGQIRAEAARSISILGESSSLAALLHTARHDQSTHVRAVSISALGWALAASIQKKEKKAKTVGEAELEKLRLGEYAMAFPSSSLDVEGAVLDQEMEGKILSALMEIAECENGIDVVTTDVHPEKHSLAALAVEGVGGAYCLNKTGVAAFLNRKVADPDPQVRQAARDALESVTANGLKSE